MILKEKPEDFQVDEIYETPKIIEGGQFCYFKLWKRNFTTIDALQVIGKNFKYPLKYFGFAGNKDRKAVTTQLCSVKGKVQTWETHNLKIEILGTGKEPIVLGSHMGNRFRIVARDVNKKPEAIEKFVNYFGEQRFSKNNIEIGRALIKRDFKKAVAGIDQYKVKEYLEKNNTNFIGALRELPKRILKIYVHAYQSYLWNKGVKEYVALGGNGTFPLIGFGTETGGIAKEIVNKLMEQEDIKMRDFVFREIPEISAEGGEREVFVDVNDLIIGELEDCEIFKGNKKITVEFALGKGCYATEFIKQLFA